MIQKNSDFYYEFLSAGQAAFIIKWIMDDNLTKQEAADLLTIILLQIPKPHDIHF